jgi:hypothetical protein
MNDPAENAVREFLGDKPGAHELREMREALLKRLKSMEEDLSANPEDERLLNRIRATRHQVAVLAEEEAITGFVEETVRASVLDDTMPLPAEPPTPPAADPALPAWADLDIEDVPET